MKTIAKPHHSGNTSKAAAAQGQSNAPIPTGQPENPGQAANPAPYLFPPRSTHPRHAAALTREVALHWAKPPSEAPLWLRESFPNRRPPAGRLWAYTTDSRGRVVRAFCANQDSIAAYAELQRQRNGTCPIEGVWPPSITPGRPAESAHPYLLRLQQEPTPYRFADDLCDAADDAAAAINARITRRGLALTGDDFERLLDAVADVLQSAEVVEVRP